MASAISYAADAPAPKEEKPEAKTLPLSEEAQSLTVLKDLYGEIKSLQKPSNSQEQTEDETEAALTRLETKFNELLAGKDSVDLFTATPEETTLQDELIEIFDPLIGEIKSATADSREKDSLRSQIELLEQRKIAINSALERIQKIITIAKDKEQNVSPTMINELLAREKVWLARREQAMLVYDTAKLQLSQKEKQSSNVVESASKVIGKFFKTRGFHLFIGLGAASLILFAIRFGYRSFTKVSPFHNQERFMGTAKTIDGAVHMAGGLFFALTLLLTFFLCDDWVLLSASLLIFVGIFWALRDKLADVSEEIRLILNIGAVREGERIVYEGLSWKVDKIRVYSRLINPELDGGKLRIPISSMVGLRSRPCNERDRYFPTSTNDWVILSDGTFGKILRQSPEFVELIKLGGTRKTYQTRDFLALSPENLSGTSFRISSTFGVDYKHQALATETIPTELQSHIQKGITDYLDVKDHFKRLNVEFSSAASSSLDFTILADFASEVAPRYHVLSRLIQKLAVEACNEHGWEIPFAQLTIHQAES